jgi:ABC-type transporter Mla subunit MlaD
VAGRKVALHHGHIGQDFVSFVQNFNDGGNLAVRVGHLRQIEQLTGVLDERQGRLQALVVELRTALEAGGATSDSVRETVAALDALLARFDRSASPTAGTPSRPFDVTEYTEALRQMGDTAQLLQALLAQADSKAPALTQVSDRAADRVASMVDHVYWRLVQLVLLLVAASVLGALAYRAIVRRAGK